MKRAYVFVLALTFGGQAPSLLAQSPGCSLSLTISAPRTKAKSASDVRIAVTLKNNSEKTCSFTRRPGPDLRYDVLVVDGNGKLAPKTRFYHEASDEPPGAIHGGSYIVETVKPGEELHGELTLGTFFELTRQDKYVVHLQFRDPSSGTTVKSNALSIDVTP
jgi:hypothetical protein